ncbi:hypothetical protein CMO88_01330 [Candidatus Woesearchaeota archaeon]|nr:hypothetical protein [Candidatus Woesearchaeota archaeon]|tara:strand:+ start:16714 stop:17064 length:351 start_codon:yes stop_codon:yes gene_type:complete
MLTKNVVRDLKEINRNFANGVIVNKGSLEFALNAASKSNDWQEQLAYIVRALLCDHIFVDGNKRAAAAYIMAMQKRLKYRYDSFKIDKLVLDIARNNIADVKKIRRRIQNATPKHI